jgi:hypothetical protein
LKTQLFALLDAGHFQVAKGGSIQRANQHPDPTAGWQTGALEVEELDTVSSDFEAMAGGISGKGAGISIRLKLKRHYTSDQKRVDITIGSMDFRATAMVDTVWDDSISAAELMQQGITRRMVGTFRSLSAVHEADAGWVINVGSAGVVVVECTYANCFVDTEDLVGALNLSEIKRFVAFDHRK